MVRMDDIFIVPLPLPLVMDILTNHDRIITVTIIPQLSEDSHPQINSAIIEGTQPETTTA